MFDLVVDRGNGPERAPVSLGALVAWERARDRSALDLQDGLRLDDLLFLAHRTFDNALDLDGFIATVKTLSTEPSAGPTGAA